MDTLSRISEPIAASMKLFQETYDQALFTTNPILKKVVDHIHQSKGKQMRPMLVMLCAQLCGDLTSSTIHAATSLELLHVASLIHDDIVDESDERRGQASVSAAFHNKVAVLAGDYFLSTSLTESVFSENLAVIKTISNLGKQLISGELLQLSGSMNTQFSEEKYFEIIRSKTAVLFTACARLGALSSKNQDIEKELALVKLGEIIGLCFQLKDDLFDYDINAQTGKPTGNDIKEGKMTLPLLHVYQQSNAAEKEELLQLFKEQKVEALREIAWKKGGIRYTEKKIQEWVQEGKNILQAFPASATRNALELYIQYVADRNK